MKLKKRFALSLRNNLRFIPDEEFIRMCFKAKLHYKLDLDHPRPLMRSFSGASCIITIQS